MCGSTGICVVTRTVTNEVSTSVVSTVVVWTGTGTSVVTIVTVTGLVVAPLPSVVVVESGS